MAGHVLLFRDHLLTPRNSMGVFDIFKKKQGTYLPTESPDYSLINSNEKAEELYHQKLLVKLYLMPLEFGGEDSLLNALYVPEFVTVRKAKFDAVIKGLLEKGEQVSYTATPIYKGDSFIPSKLTIQTGGSQTLTEAIDIW
jgi:hypothetical protein